VTWIEPSARTAELIRACIERMLENPEELFEAIDAVSIPAEFTGASNDPVLLKAFQRANRSTILQWAEANLRDPGREVSPNIGPEIVSLTRDLVRRGLDADALEPYRAGQNVAWQQWMQVVFAETQDPDELRELLDVSARSIFAYVEATMMETMARIQRDRDEFSQTGRERLETVVLLLEGAPIDPGYAESRLNYTFEGEHTAAIIWSEGGIDPVELEAAAEALAEAAGSSARLMVHASSAALWCWVKAKVDGSSLEERIEVREGIRYALGTASEGIEGFTRSHADAFEAQRLVARLDLSLPVARYESMRVVALLTHDHERAKSFVEETLGSLAEAPETLTRTVRNYLRNQSNATRTAQAMFAHRNTILARIAKADEMLPTPLAETAFEVSAALEILFWQES
jgi:DNA-binding PucR family transcriptional regulator